MEPMYSTLADAERAFDGPIPDHVLQHLTETPEQRCLRLMRRLSGDAAFYEGRLLRIPFSGDPMSDWSVCLRHLENVRVTLGSITLQLVALRA